MNCADGRTMTYLWTTGQPIKVTTGPDGAPRRFKQGETWHIVERVLDRWRVDEGWWEDRVWRSSFRLITRDGLLVVVYRDLLEKKWYLQRLYD